MTRRLWLVYALGGVAAGGLALALVLTSDHETRPVVTLVFGLLLGWAFILTGTLATLRRPDNRTGLLLALVGFTWFLGSLSEANGSLLFTVGQWLSPVVIAAFVHLVIAYPRGRLGSRLERGIVVASYALAFTGALPLLLFRERPPNYCDRCPSNAFFVSEHRALWDVVNVAVDVSAGVLLASTLVILVRRWRGASAAYRRSLRAVLAAAGVGVGGLLLAFAVDPISSDAAGVVSLVGAVGVLAVPFVFLAGLMRGRFVAGTVGRLVTQLGRTPEPWALRDAFRAALHDPTLQLAYWLPEAGAYVDAEGRFFEPPEGRSTTVIEDREGPIAALVHDPSLDDEEGLVGSAVAAARLAILNERFQAELRARVNELEQERDFTRLVVDSTPALFCVVDPDGRIVRYNRSLETLSGHDDDERVRGRLFWELFSVPERAEQDRAALAAAAAGLNTEGRKSLLPTPDGPRLVDWLDVRIPDEHGQLRFLLEAGIDVTEREQNLAGLRGLAEEQAALRRVAEVVASVPSVEEFMDSVTEEAALLLGADVAHMVRYEDHDLLTGMGSWSAPSAQALPSGEVRPIDSDTVVWKVRQSGRSARQEGYDELPGTLAERLRSIGLHSSIGSPITVSGRLWGAVIVSRTREEPFEQGAEERLERFAALAGQAIANAQARDEITSLAAEQAALRRVATLVARSSPEEALFAAVSEEVGRLFSGQTANIIRHEGPTVRILGGWTSEEGRIVPAGEVYPATADSSVIRAIDSAQPTRVDSIEELRDGGGKEVWRNAGLHAAIAAPIIVEGNVWGGLCVFKTHPEELFQPGSETRLGDFAALVAQAVANAEAQAQLTASRARIVQATDDARRKLERNLHDGAQQRLVSLSLSLRLAQARLRTDPEGADEILSGASTELAQALEELRELARGIHPAVLTDRGLGPALETLAQRSSLPVEIHNAVEERLPGPVEAAAYYVVSESLANVAKYARASTVRVTIARDDGVARVEVADDGIGGADPAQGSGLRGLADRVEALDGRLEVASVNGGGTVVRAQIPVRPHA
jgi:PAS domain S-box-containing protein